MFEDVMRHRRQKEKIKKNDEEERIRVDERKREERKKERGRETGMGNVVFIKTNNVMVLCTKLPSLI